MRENMPGQGYAQGHTDLVNRGPRKMNTFDNTYMKGRFSQNIRKQGETPGLEFDDSAEAGIHRWRSNNLEDESYMVRPTGYNRPANEDPYVQSLHEFFADRIDLWPATERQREWIRSIMFDLRSTRDIAEDQGYSDHTAIVKGRKRAVDAFIEYMGGKAELAEKLRTFLHAHEMADGRDRLKFLPRWVRG